MLVAKWGSWEVVLVVLLLFSVASPVLAGCGCWCAYRYSAAAGRSPCAYGYSAAATHPRCLCSAGPERSVLLWPPKGNINRRVGELAGHSAGVVQVVMADAHSQVGARSLCAPHGALSSLREKGAVTRF